MATTIWERITTALTALATPMAAGTYIAATAAALPDLYMVYSLIDAMPEQHADNTERLRSYLVQISVYNRAGLISLPDVIGAMVTAGFMFTAGRQLDYDAESRHFGLAFDFEYYEAI